MSSMIIHYLDNKVEKKSIVGIQVYADKGFIYYKIGDKQHYIPLCNVREVEIIGANKIRRR